MFAPWLCDEHGNPLDESQRELAVRDGEHILINAGPGSGKTRVLVAHYLHLMMTRKDWDIEAVVAITFTEKAASEMKERVGKVLQRVIQEALGEKERRRAQDLLDRLPEAPIGTIHSFCARLLRRFALEGGIDPTFTILDEWKAQSLRREVCERWLWRHLENDPDAQKVVSHWGFHRSALLLTELLNQRLLIEHRRIHGRPVLCRLPTPLEEEEEALERCYEKILKAYETEKSERNAFDFDDLLLRAWELLRDEGVREKVRRIYRRILVDELQDIDRVQREIIALLCDWENPNGKVKFFGVGDSQQSIYGFRNADVSIFNELWDEVEGKKGWRRGELKTNYRSVKALVALTNYVFERIFTIRERDDPSPRRLRTPLQRMNAYRTETSPSPPLEFVSFSFPSKTVKGQRLRWEAEWVSERVKGLHKEGFAFRDIAILLRELIHVSLFEEALRRKEIPYHILSGYGFFEAMEARDLLSFLRVIAEPDDSLALAAWLRSPMVGVSDETLFAIRPFWDEGIAPQILEKALKETRLPDGERKKLERAVKWLHRAFELSDRIRPCALLEWLLKETCYEAIVAALPHGRQRLADIRKFLRIIREIGEGLRLTLRGLVRYIHALAEGEARIGEPPTAGAMTDAVQVMTIHAAKGLEFPVVIIPMLGEVEAPRGSKSDVIADPDIGVSVRLRDEGGGGKRTLRFEAVDERRQRRERAELERLLFVAWTRAKERLILVGSSDETERKRKGEGWQGWLRLISETLQIPPGKGEGSKTVIDGVQVWSKGMEVTEEGWDQVKALKPLTETVGARWLVGKETLPDLTPPSLEFPPKTPPLLRFFVTDLVSEEFMSRSGIVLEDTFTALEIGKIVHRLLQAGIVEPSEDQILWVAQTVGAEIEGVLKGTEKIRHFLRKAFRAPIWREIESARRSWYELDFHVQVGDASGEGPALELVGRWDLIARLSGPEWVIVDFKTDALASHRGARERFERVYLWQAKAYAYAAHKVFKAPSVRTVFVFLALPEPYEVHRSFPETGWDELAAELKGRAFSLFNVTEERKRDRVG